MFKNKWRSKLKIGGCSIVLQAILRRMIFFSSSEIKIDWLKRFWVDLPNRTFPTLGLLILARQKKAITNTTYNFILYNSCSIQNHIKTYNKKKTCGTVRSVPLTYISVKKFLVLVTFDCLYSKTWIINSL